MSAPKRKTRTDGPAEDQPRNSDAQLSEFEQLKGLIESLKKDLRKEIKDGNATIQEQITSEKELVKQQIDSLKTQLNNTIDEKIGKFNDSLTAALRDNEKIKQDNTVLRLEMDSLKSNLCLLKHKLSEQNEKIIQLESHGRRENLIFSGIRQDAHENCSAKVKSVIENNMGIDPTDIRFDRCHRLGGPKPQPIIVRFNWHEDRMRVFRAKSKLVNSSISVQEDFPSEYVERRKSLYPIMKLARSAGSYSVLRGDKLIIDDKTYSVDTLHHLPPEIDPASACTKKYDNVLAFFGGHAPLSNFFQCNIIIDRKSYSSVEQFFQYQKAIFANKPETASKILQTNSPIHCKRLGDSVKLTEDEWLPEAKRVMYAGMKAKFSQNDRARHFLMDTGSCDLAEAGPSKIWGTGLKLVDPKNGNRHNWSGNNVTGEILMKVRNDI
jgi:ribA/ribD-fused uncharacterized protein